MLYSEKDLEKIYEYKTWSDRKKIDELLRLDCDMYANLGIESPKKDRESARVNSRKIYRIIKRIDQDMGTQLLMHMDKKGDNG